MTDGTPEEIQGVELPADPLSAFSSLMDTLVAEEEPAPADESGAAAAAAAAGTGSPAPAEQGAGPAGTPAAAPAAGAAGSAGVPSATGAAAPEAATGVDASEYDSNWGEVTAALEKKNLDEQQALALAEVRTEFANYFEAVEKHPRLLVGTEVPSTKGTGMETLRDSEDARDWQDAIKLQLAQEVKDRASRKSDDTKPLLQTVHAAIQMFQQNPDLIPGTKQFDKELADRFARYAKPYEHRVDGKLTGYSIPVQGLLAQVRDDLVASRAATAAAAPAPQPTAQQQRAAAQPRVPTGQFTNPEAPQAGIPTQAGNSSAEAEDFSALFGTLGLPNLRI